MQPLHAPLLAIGLFVLCSAPALSQDTQPEAAADLAPSIASSPAAPADDYKMVCRRQDVTGSFVQKRKVCRTRAEWRRLADDHRAQAQDYVDHGRGGSNGN